MIQNSRNSQDYRNFPTIPTNSRDSPESQNSPEIPILQNRFTTNHAVFSSKNINCVAFPRGSPLYEVITRRGIMGWFSKVKGIFSLIMRTGQKAAKETSHRLCLHGQLFKVTVPANCIRPRQTILLLYE